MACPHFDVSIRQRSKGKSAVAGAAYQAGETLFSEYDQRTKNYRYKAKEIMAKGILLPPHAPREYADRQTLWNAVETSEKAWNAQLARGIIMALPRELPADQYEPLVRDYCMEQFVSRGMIADYAIHNKDDGNPHVHIMLTMRAMDENGKWLPKAKRVYVLDENGQRIPLPKGDYKTFKERTTGWDDRSNCELWRTSWADITNRFLEHAGSDVRLDLRSFERQGVEQVPTIHLGPTIAHMEKKGIPTEIGDYNRSILKHNGILKTLKGKLAEMKEWLHSAINSAQELFEPVPKQPSLMVYIETYLSLQKSTRSDWGKASKQTSAVNDAKLTARILNWMQKTGVSTLEDFNAHVSRQQEALTQPEDTGRAIKQKQTSLRHLETYRRLKPISDKSKQSMGLFKKQYAQKHRKELNDFAKAVRYMKANGLKPNDETQLRTDLEKLRMQKEQLRAKLLENDIDPEMISTIRRCVDAVIQAGEEPQYRISVKEQLQRAQAKHMEMNNDVQKYMRKSQCSL